jgi:hypothetical protein
MISAVLILMMLVHYQFMQFAILDLQENEKDGLNLTHLEVCLLSVNRCIVFLDKTSHPAAGVPVQDLHPRKGASCKFLNIFLLILVSRNSLHC